MAYTACTDKDCTWDANGEPGDVERAYKAHRKNHPTSKAQAQLPAPEAEVVPEPKAK